ncbi:hypothetical protein A4X09_0g3046 [Tilletia walkeri]|uniref:Cutinase n=1 Tax=Tilletia walkeri TaxID=117179 RepID=A0A8X7N9U4_9BASI|nr:hypothetical protein A4X09_0g3046 [Tilletia walkeri]
MLGSTLLLALVLPFVTPAVTAPIQRCQAEPATVPPPASPPTVGPGGCQDFVIIDSRGTNEPQGRSFQFAKMIQETLDTVPGGISVSNPYPASVAPNSAANGSTWLRNYLQQGVAACPEQKYALLGVSQGAVVTWNAIADLVKDDPIYTAIDAIVVEGDPFRIPNVPGNVDEHGGDGTKESEGMMRAGSSDENIAKWALTGKLLDICYSGDPVCNRQGKSPMDHGKYGGTAEVQTLGAQFLAQHLDN